jgi:uncharacterized coiled-coil protein SlyX
MGSITAFTQYPARVACRSAVVLAIACICAARHAGAQTAPETPEQRLERLSAAVAQVQSQMSAYQTQLQELQKQIADLQAQMQSSAATAPGAPTALTAPATAADLEEMRERQAIAESQIATHEQSKVETESKYSLKLTGLLLFNTMVSTRRVDNAVDPTYALDGAGTTALSLRQTVLGFDAIGPHLLGASSRADLRVDFFGDSAQATYGSSGLLRLRTAHAALQWKHTEAFVALDRAIFVPNMPTSLVSTGQPNLSWSGDLWTWNPQIGVSHDFVLRGTQRLQVQGGLIDPQDPLLPSTTTTATASRAEHSRWPGVESRVAIASGEHGVGPEFGVGGYFSPHKTGSGASFDAWAITGDLRLPVGRHFELTSSAYRGAGLGGLGGGGYIDYFYRVDNPTMAQALRDTGGWVQTKIKTNDRLQFNGGFGIDNPFAADIRLAYPTAGTTYMGLTKNRGVFGNVIVSPSNYLLFSLEYRRLLSNYQAGPTRSSDTIGIAAGYRF